MRIQQGPDVVDISIGPQSSSSRLAADELRLRVSVACRGFKAKHTLALGRAAFDTFLKELRAVERRRRGTATLKARDTYTRVALRVVAFDAAGHTSIEVELEHGWFDLRPREAKLSASFEFDPSTLPRAVEQFEAFLAAV
jgi:hypothetical protein